MRKPITSLLGIALLAIGPTAANAQSDIHLYLYDTHTGAVTQASPAMDFETYNASFSNNRQKLVHDLVIQGGTPQTLGVTDLTTGTMTPLGLEGDNAVWSPNGKYIAYHNWTDWEASGYDPNVPVQLRIVPASGGTPIAVLDWATNASWSNNSRRLAFVDFFGGYVGTVGLDGTATKFDFDTIGSFEGYGCNPDYSPDGKLIVYERYECYFGVPGPLMAIPVNEKGQALGAPYAITSGAYFAGQPSFSNDGKTIVFSRCPVPCDPRESGLYTVSVYGGDPVLLFDRPEKGEYDPAYSKNGRYVVFSGPE